MALPPTTKPSRGLHVRGLTGQEATGTGEREPVKLGREVCCGFVPFPITVFTTVGSLATEAQPARG